MNTKVRQAPLVVVAWLSPSAVGISCSGSKPPPPAAPSLPTRCSLTRRMFAIRSSRSGKTSWFMRW